MNEVVVSNFSVVFSRKFECADFPPHELTLDTVWIKWDAISCWLLRNTLAIFNHRGSFKKKINRLRVGMNDLLWHLNSCSYRVTSRRQSVIGNHSTSKQFVAPSTNVENDRRVTWLGSREVLLNTRSMHNSYSEFTLQRNARKILLKLRIVVVLNVTISRVRSRLDVRAFSWTETFESIIETS